MYVCTHIHFTNGIQYMYILSSGDELLKGYGSEDPHFCDSRIHCEDTMTGGEESPSGNILSAAVD